MKNITLIGMPGAGKSTVGVVLAKTLGMDFLDTDLLIQKNEHTTLQQIIDTQGTQAFRRIEDETVARVNVEDTVIAPGGSIIYGENAMRNLKAISTVIYLRLSAEAVISRITNLATRGISMRQGQTLSDLFDERDPLYEKYADFIIDTQELSIAQTVERIRAVV